MIKLSKYLTYILDENKPKKKKKVKRSQTSFDFDDSEPIREVDYYLYR